jgi:hypothetical protein
MYKEDVSEGLEQRSHQNKEKFSINICPQILSFRGTAQHRVNLGPLDLYLWRFFKP